MIELLIHDVPADQEIIGMFGRLEKDIIVSLGFICWVPNRTP